jgi:hypothetical protein
MKINPVATGCIGGVGSLVSAVIGGFVGLEWAGHYMKTHPADRVFPGELVGGLFYGAIVGPIVFLVLYCVLLVVLSLWRTKGE